MKITTYDNECFNQDANIHPDKQSSFAHWLATDIQQAIEDFFDKHNLP